MPKNGSSKQTSSWKTAEFGEMDPFLVESLPIRGQMRETGSLFAMGTSESQQAQPSHWGTGSGSVLKVAMLLDRIRMWISGFIWKFSDTCLLYYVTGCLRLCKGEYYAGWPVGVSMMHPHHPPLQFSG